MFHIIKLYVMFVCTIILSSWAVQKQVPCMILVMDHVWDPTDYNLQSPFCPPLVLQ